MFSVSVGPISLFSDGLQQHINGRLVLLCKVFVKSKKTFNTGMMTLESKILHLAFSSPAAASPPPAVQHLNLASPAISSPSHCKVDHLHHLAVPGCHLCHILESQLNVELPATVSRNQPVWNLCCGREGLYFILEKAQPSLRH